MRPAPASCLDLSDLTLPQRSLAVARATGPERQARRVSPAPPATAYPPPVDGQPPYGGYGGNGPYGAYPPPAPPRSGVGSAVAAGLGGVAAGMLLDEALRGHGESGFGGGETRAAGPIVDQPVDPAGQAYDDLRDEPIDMGNDDSSWDDSGSSDDDSW